MRKILLGTASVLAASTLLLGTANESHAALGDALTPASTDYSLATVFGPKMTAAGIKAFVAALDAASAATPGSTGIRGFAAGAATDEGLSVPKALDNTANKIGAATSWNKLANPVSARLPLVDTPHTTFSAGQWQGVKFLSCGLKSTTRSYTQSTVDPSIYSSTDTPAAIATDATTFNAGLAAANTAASATGTSLFTTVIPASIRASAAGTDEAIGGAAAVYNVYIKPSLTTQTATAAPASQIIGYIISCFGVTRATTAS